MLILDVLLFLLLMAVLGLGVLVAISIWLSMPVVDVLNGMLRRVGLAGAHRRSRSIGAHGIGVVDEPFRLTPDGERGEGRLLVQGEIWNARCAPAIAADLARGDEVEFEYADDLSVIVIGKSRSP